MSAAGAGPSVLTPWELIGYAGKNMRTENSLQEVVGHVNVKVKVKSHREQLAYLFFPDLAKAQTGLNNAQPLAKCFATAARKEVILLFICCDTWGVPVRMWTQCTKNFGVPLFLFGFKPFPAVFANFNMAA